MAGQYTLQQLQQMGLIGQDTLNPMFTGLFGLNGLGDGYSNQNTGAPAWMAGDSMITGESGVPGAYLSGIGSGFSPEAINKANGYSFDWTKTGPRGAGTLTAFDPTGQQAGQYQQQSDSTFWQSVLEAGALAAAGFGGVGLMGLGPLGGLLGGVGGAGAAAGGGGGGAGALGSGVIEAGMADAAANLAAYGSTAFAPANVAATMAGIPALGAAGVGAASAIPYLTADAGAGLAEFGAGAFTPSNVAATSAGIPTIGAGASAAPAVFNAAKDSQAANAAMQAAGTPTGAAIAPSGVNLGSLGGTMSAAGGGLLSGLGSLGTTVGNALQDPKVIGGLIGTGAQLIGAGKASDAIGDAAAESNALYRYMYDTTRQDNMPALNARNQALTQAMGLLADPSSITRDPGYQFTVDQGVKAYGNSGAAKGMRLSGQQAKALTEFGQNTASNRLTESIGRLTAVASGGQPGAGTIASAGSSFANGSSGNALMAGNAASNLYMGLGTGVGNAINSLTAYPGKKNWWEKD